MIRVTHPFGNANVRAVIQALHEERLLERFDTTLNGHDRWVSYLPQHLRKEFERRTFNLPDHLVDTLLLPELLRHGCQRIPVFKTLTQSENSLSPHAVWKARDKATAKTLNSRVHAVYAYEDGARQTFEKARQMGIPCIYDLPIGYYRSAQKIFAEDKERLPQFASLLEGAEDSTEKLQRKQEEAELADVIIACSSFVKQTLLEAGVDEKKIACVQFGVAEHIASKLYSADTQRPLKVLFVGRLTQRKGIGYLLNAVQGIREIELHMLGTKVGGEEVLARYNFVYHKPLPQHEVWELMKTCDVLALPSLFEGQALVVLEAMMCGLPVVVTPNAGFEGIVQHGEQGFTVPVGSAEALQGAIMQWVNHRDLVVEMGRKARLKAQSLTWASYRQQIVSIAQSLLKVP